MVGLQRHYQDNYIQTIDRIHNGQIGDIIGGQVFWNDGGVWVRERQPGQTEMEYQMRNWYYFNWLCGDHITEQHVHNLDVANWVKIVIQLKPREQEEEQLGEARIMGRFLTITWFFYLRRWHCHPQ